MGQYSLFGADEAAVQHGAVEIPELEWDKKLRLGFEKEMLGLYVSDHPLFGVEAALSALATTTVAGLWEMEDGTGVTIGGIVAGINRRYTRAGDPMLFFQLEDLTGAVEVVAFPRTVAEAGPLIRDDEVLLVGGRLDHRGDDVKVIAQQVRAPELDPNAAVRLKVPAVRLSRNVVENLKSALANHPGSAPVYLEMQGEDDKVFKLECHVEPRSALFAELRALLGPACL